MFNDTIIQGSTSWNDPQKGKINFIDVSLQGQSQLTVTHLEAVLGNDMQSFILHSRPLIHSGNFEMITHDDNSKVDNCLKDFDSYFLSYASKKNFVVACYSGTVENSNGAAFICLRTDVADAIKFCGIAPDDGEQMRVTLVKNINCVGHGKCGCPCSFWVKSHGSKSSSNLEGNGLTNMILTSAM